MGTTVLWEMAMERRRGWWLAVEQRPHRATDFDAVIRWTRAELVAAANLVSSPKTPYWQPANVLKRCAYALGRTLLSRGKLDELKDFLKERDSAAATRANDNPFVWTLRLLSHTDWTLKPTDRTRYAWQLYYAYLNNIATSAIDPFLAGAGTYDAMRGKIQRDLREGWSEHLALSKLAVVIEPAPLPRDPERKINAATVQAPPQRRSTPTSRPRTHSADHVDEDEDWI